MLDVARAVSGIPQADPGERVALQFRHRLIAFRHFTSGSLALTSVRCLNQRDESTRRRDFMAAIGITAAWPFVADAETDAALL